MNQTKRLLSLTRRRWVSPLVALQSIGCLRLGARIYDLRRQGHQFDERWRKLPNGKMVKEFKLR